jgi:hypothetical protein
VSNVNKEKLEAMEIHLLMELLDKIQAKEKLVKDVIRAKIYSIEKPR